MSNQIIFMKNLEYIDFIVYLFRTAFICLFSYLTFIKFSESSFKSFLHNLVTFVFIIFNTFIVSYMKFYISSQSSIFFLILTLSIIFSISNDTDFSVGLFLTLVSTCINYILYSLSIVFSFLPVLLFHITNDYISLLIILFLYTFLFFIFIHQKKLKHGISFIKKISTNDYTNLLILNSSILILFFFNAFKVNYHTPSIYSLQFYIISLVIFFITIYQSFSLYYKHNLLVKELNDTKLELEKKDKEIERLEKENLEFSKTSHSIAHKQRVLEYKLNQLQLNTEFANELDFSDKLKEISDTYSSNVTNLTLPKTSIENIDDILEYMQSECTKNNINFELQLNGDIFSMVTTVINKEKLEILLADHIKNAIIAINSSKNINKSILVRLGLTNDIYSIYFYDSGIEFDENVLSSLGKEQITTHKDIGGTGCGFLNTFDTLKEFNASLEINEISAPCKDNYTKSIVIKFDGKNDFEINSYKKQE